jgi:hypothetical protein
MRGPASRKFKLVGYAQRFLGAHAAVSNLFNLGRHKVIANANANAICSVTGGWLIQFEFLSDIDDVQVALVVSCRQQQIKLFVPHIDRTVA